MFAVMRFRGAFRLRWAPRVLSSPSIIRRKHRTTATEASAKGQEMTAASPIGNCWEEQLSRWFIGPPHLAKLCVEDCAHRAQGRALSCAVGRDVHTACLWLANRISATAIEIALERDRDLPTVREMYGHAFALLSAIEALTTELRLVPLAAIGTAIKRPYSVCADALLEDLLSLRDVVEEGVVDILDDLAMDLNESYGPSAEVPDAEKDRIRDVFRLAAERLSTLAQQLGAQYGEVRTAAFLSESVQRAWRRERDRLRPECLP